MNIFFSIWTSQIRTIMYEPEGEQSRTSDQLRYFALWISRLLTITNLKKKIRMWTCFFIFFLVVASVLFIFFMVASRYNNDAFHSVEVMPLVSNEGCRSSIELKNLMCLLLNKKLSKFLSISSNLLFSI